MRCLQIDVRYITDQLKETDMSRLLVLGNKRYSSWSLRGYLALKMAGLPFDEAVIPLFTSETHSEIKKYAPEAPARVPLLLDEGTAIWDTIAIMEYAAEMAEGKSLWPEDRFARSEARSVVAEMHAGFVALREHIPMNLIRKDPYTKLPDAVEEDIARILAIWKRCRERYGEAGPYLFGNASLVDVAYAPVVIRFLSRSVPLDDIYKEYCNAVWDLPGFAEWRDAADKEKWVIDQ